MKRKKRPGSAGKTTSTKTINIVEEKKPEPEPIEVVAVAETPEVTTNLEELKEAVAIIKETQEQRTFTSEQLLDGLYWIHGIFEKATMTMVLHGITGYCAIMDVPLEGKGVYIATRQLEWDSGNRYVIDTLAQYASMEDGRATYVANNGVPVFLRILPDDYCISSPDTKLYAHEYFQLPNPYKRFEEVYGR